MVLWLRFLGGRMHGDNKSFVMENQQQNFKHIPMYYFCSTTLFCGLTVNPTESNQKDCWRLWRKQKQAVAS